jgi:hypothetical protein
MPAASLDLSAPFIMDELFVAMFSMDMHASPGPDGFSPSFYKAFWAHLCLQLFGLLSDFYVGQDHLDTMNQAHLVLLLKADGFQSISLQNCHMKLFSKIMVNHLKNAIPTLINTDQTSFVHSQNIAEDFVYATNLL